jgi:hypothetical protein
VSPADIAGVLALAMVQSSLVALPRPGALASLTRLRAPAWAALLPGSIVIGTALPLWHHSLAMAIVALAAATTPLLAAVAVLRVMRGRRLLLVAAAPVVLATAVFAHGLARQLSLTALTALAALAVGVTLTRLIPPRWLVVGIGLMAALDALLLANGVGGSAAGSLATATASFHGPALDQAAVGPATMDYPDLVLAAVLGGAVAGTPVQRRAAATMTLLAAATGMCLAVVSIVPSTVPVALTVLRLEAGPLWRAISARVRNRTPLTLRGCGHPAWRTCASCTS